jgi:hypothetical protein
MHHIIRKRLHVEIPEGTISNGVAKAVHGNLAHSIKVFQ